MLLVNEVEALRGYVKGWRQSDEKVAFVPTMGNLHAGHLDLVEAARQHADRTVVSIFVNPMQFGEGEDFDAYPRTLEEDRAKLQEVGVDLLFAPAAKTIYPSGTGQQTRVEVPDISDILCGATRPGHFVGVATIVCKLFNMVQPDIAVFGEKDYQQLMVIRHMVNDLAIPIEILGKATVREPDGLAMSSRNGYLDAGERKQAPALYRLLRETAAAINSGAKDYAGLERQALKDLEAAGFRPDYFVIRTADNLQAPREKGETLVILAAAYLGTTRLIDNLIAA
ncbi:MAG: pantoate--beta-alanine ligase [Candidatus Thiodiazotropha sp. (ex Monitilora ramsayi)]|nr:pantoate--beta-alanine ligase [Candidatus Thiodiazotropha sp. (ex Monitilora ramsayi)]